MKVTFHIRFHTVWGQKICLAGSVSHLGAWDNTLVEAMHYEGGGNWSLEIELPNDTDAVEYRYVLHTDDKQIFEEWERKHRLTFDGKSTHYIIYDYWYNRPANLAFYSSAFTQSLFARQEDCSCNSQAVESGRRIVIRLFAPRVEKHQQVAVTGNQPALGNWDTAKALPLSDRNFPEWQIALDASAVIFPLEYKFILRDTDTAGSVIWEDGENRVLTLPPPNDGECTVISAPAFRDSHLPALHYAGTVIPVFSLRSEEDCGIGDLGDLHRLVDWMKQTGQCVIQVLPVNDTTATLSWRDSYPYNAISVYAIHPVYISLAWLGALKDKKKAAHYEHTRQKLNALDAIDYESVIKTKFAYCHDYFLENPSVLDTDAYKAFFAENESWLVPYAGFCLLRDRYGTPDFTAWGEDASYNPDRISGFVAKDETARQKLNFTYFLQYILDSQFRRVTTYARSQGVVLKGDLPIGVNRDSVEAWTEPQYFNMQSQAGAPPDDFSVNGQNWGFPTYNWEAMERDGFTWWKKRFRKLSHYFDCFRIDHILGFFRIWEIPVEYKEGLYGHFNPALPLTREEIEACGFPFDEVRHTANFLFLRDPRDPQKFHPRISASNSPAYQELDADERTAYDRLYWDFFYHRHNDFWKAQAVSRLSPLVSAVNILICGEDLGMIPQSVPEVMSQLQLLSLEIERMPKQADREFTDLATIPYLSVCTTSTHDMSPLRSWWKEDREKTQRYYNNVLNLPGEAPADCTPDLATRILANHLASPSMLALIPLQDWLATGSDSIRRADIDSERINIPSVPNHYWRYRMHLTLETLMSHDEFNRNILHQIKKAGRGN
ncbi:4-alpha-glucanotransferase [Bacteroidales bacterium Barb7]|nr:4-alpha-glucanotransferase [Bacteroidales bacterium Barb7]